MDFCWFLSISVDCTPHPTTPNHVVMFLLICSDFCWLLFLFLLLVADLCWILLSFPWILMIPNLCVNGFLLISVEFLLIAVDFSMVCVELCWIMLSSFDSISADFQWFLLICVHSCCFPILMSADFCWFLVEFWWFCKPSQWCGWCWVGWGTPPPHHTKSCCHVSVDL